MPRRQRYPKKNVEKGTWTIYPFACLGFLPLSRLYRLPPTYSAFVQA